MIRNLHYVIASIVLINLASLANATPVSIDFEPPTYSLGAIAGQDGWSGPDSVVSSALTRFGAIGGTQSALAGGSMARDVSSAIESTTPFSFLWDWSDVFSGNSRFGDFEIQVAGTRIAKFGADISGGTDTRIFAYGLVSGASTIFQQIKTGGLRPLLSVTGELRFASNTYDVVFTDLGTGTAYSFTGLNMITSPTLAAAQADTDFTTINIEGNHYLDNIALGVPEPTSIVQLGGCLLSLAFASRRR